MTKRLVPLAALPLVLGACQTVPYTGRSQMLLLSKSEETKLGDQAYRDLIEKARLSGDRKSVALVRKVGRRIAEAANHPDFRWEFNLIQDDNMINAFCLPGGKVAFYTGILAVAGGEDGVAVVMGHEVAHALARHGAERMSHGMLVNFGGQALSVLLAKKPAATRRLFGEAYGIGAGVGMMLPFSRKHETEADKIGLILMAKAGYDPAEAVLFWKRMGRASGGNKPPEFLSTHPAGTTRIRQIQDWLPEIKRLHFKPRN